MTLQQDERDEVEEAYWRNFRPEEESSDGLVTDAGHQGSRFGDAAHLRTAAP